MTAWISPLTLTGRHVTLVPLAPAHAPALAEAACDGELWRLWYTSVPAPAQMGAEIERRQVSFLKKDDILKKEMEVFEAEVRGTSVFYGHPRGYHDDAVMAAALLVERMAQRHRFGKASVSSYATFGAQPKRKLVAA